MSTVVVFKTSFSHLSMYFLLCKIQFVLHVTQVLVNVSVYLYSTYPVAVKEAGAGGNSTSGSSNSSSDKGEGSPC